VNDVFLSVGVMAYCANARSVDFTVRGSDALVVSSFKIHTGKNACATVSLLQTSVGGQERRPTVLKSGRGSGARL
jgi:hypothetical protein